MIPKISLSLLASGFIDPKDNPEVEIQGDEVVKYPKLQDFEPITVKAERIKDMNEQITTSNWEVVDQV